MKVLTIMEIGGNEVLTDDISDSKILGIQETFKKMISSEQSTYYIGDAM